MTPPAAHGFERLYERHWHELRAWLTSRTGSREEAEDIAQAAFLNAYRAYVRGDRPDKPRAWLYRIAENVRRRRFRGPRGQIAYVPLEGAPEPAAAEPELHELREALEQLPERQRAAFVLREVGGLSYAEIADRLDLTPGAVQMHLFRARTALRRSLGGRLPSLVLPAWAARAAGNVGGWLERAPAGLRAAGAAGAAVLAVTAGGSLGPAAVEPREAPRPELRAPALGARAAATDPRRGAAPLEAPVAAQSTPAAPARAAVPPPAAAVEPRPAPAIVSAAVPAPEPAAPLPPSPAEPVIDAVKALPSPAAAVDEALAALEPPALPALTSAVEELVHAAAAGATAEPSPPAAAEALAPLTVP